MPGPLNLALPMGTASNPPPATDTHSSASVFGSTAGYSGPAQAISIQKVAQQPDSDMDFSDFTSAANPALSTGVEDMLLMDMEPAAVGIGLRSDRLSGGQATDMLEFVDTAPASNDATDDMLSFLEASGPTTDTLGQFSEPVPTTGKTTTVWSPLGSKSPKKATASNMDSFLLAVAADPLASHRPTLTQLQQRQDGADIAMTASSESPDLLCMDTPDKDKKPPAKRLSTVRMSALDALAESDLQAGKEDWDDFAAVSTVQTTKSDSGLAGFGESVWASSAPEAPPPVPAAGLFSNPFDLFGAAGDAPAQTQCPAPDSPAVSATFGFSGEKFDDFGDFESSHVSAPTVPTATQWQPDFESPFDHAYKPPPLPEAGPPPLSPAPAASQTKPPPIPAMPVESSEASAPHFGPSSFPPLQPEAAAENDIDFGDFGPAPVAAFATVEENDFGDFGAFSGSLSVPAELSIVSHESVSPPPLPALPALPAGHMDDPFLSFGEAAPELPSHDTSRPGAFGIRVQESADASSITDTSSPNSAITGGLNNSAFDVFGDFDGPPATMPPPSIEPASKSSASTSASLLDSFLSTVSSAPTPSSATSSALPFLTPFLATKPAAPASSQNQARAMLCGELEALAITLCETDHFPESHACFKQASLKRQLQDLGSKKQQAVMDDNLELAIKLRDEIAAVKERTLPPSEESRWMDVIASGAHGESLASLLGQICSLDEQCGIRIKARFESALVPHPAMPVEERARLGVCLVRSHRLIRATHTTHKQHPKHWTVILARVCQILETAVERLQAFMLLSTGDRELTLQEGRMSIFVRGVVRVLEVGLWVSTTVTEAAALEAEEMALKFKSLHDTFLKAAGDWKLSFEYTLPSEQELVNQAADLVATEGVTYCNLTLRPVALTSGQRERRVSGAAYTEYCGVQYMQAAISLWVHDNSETPPTCDAVFS